jgi:nucleoside-diphosphate-sugar epimerase
MNLLITGASGFIGRNFIRALPKDWGAIAVYHRSGDFPAFVEQLGRANVRPVRIDLADEDAVRGLQSFEGSFDACVFLAANGDPAASVAGPGFDLRSNTLSLVRLVEALRFKKIIYFSSGAVYDGLQGGVSPTVPIAPVLPYAISKFASEHYLRHFQQVGRIGDVFIVRFFGAYGPFEPERKIYGRLIRRFAFEKDPRFTIRGDGHNLIDAMHVDDAIRAIQLLVTTPERGAIADCASGHPISLKNLAETVAQVFGLQAELTYVGSVPECIEFHSVDDTMRTKYQFTPRIELSEGLERFAAFLKRN